MIIFSYESLLFSNRLKITQIHACIFIFLPFWVCVYKYQIELNKIEDTGSYWMKERKGEKQTWKEFY